jgi:probable phosphoglycerate mutase
MVALPDTNTCSHQGPTGTSVPDSAAVPEGYHQRQFALPTGATEVILVRHGASAPAVPGRPFPLLDGHGDPPLSPEGKAQAVQIAEGLAGEELSALYVTTLGRTHETAAPLALRTGLAPIVVPDLREVSLGEWEGGVFRIRMAEGDPVAMQAVEEERWDVIPGAETMESLAARVRAGIEAIVAHAGPDVRVAAIVHGGVIGELCRQATASRPFAFVHADNGSFTRLVVLPGGGWLLRSFNENAHLA